MAILKTVHYVNHKILDKKGDLLFYGGDPQIKDMILNGQAVVLVYGEIKTIQILIDNFKPALSPFDYEYKYNRCVVTGVEEGLSRHHLIAERYLKSFPFDFKNQNGHDILLISDSLHKKFEMIDDPKLDKILCEKFGFVSADEYIELQFPRKYLIRTAKSLLNPNLPKERFIEIGNIFTEKSGLLPTKENLENIMNEDNIEISYSDYVKPFITDHEEFAFICRQFFIDTFNPQFLPKTWSVYGKNAHSLQG